MAETVESLLKYGSPLHARLKEMVLERRKASERKMKTFHSKWDDADDSFKAYTPTDRAMADRKAQRRAGQPDYTTIVLPYPYAVVMTAHTYWAMVYLSRAPVYQLRGRHGEAQNSIEAFEAALDYQFTVGRHAVPLFNWGFDMMKYGIGVTGNYWERKEAMMSRQVEVPATVGGFEVPFLKPIKKIQSVPVLKYEGNCLYNVRPYDWYPDPRVAVINHQDGEFEGRDTQVGWFEILEGVRQGRYFRENATMLGKKINGNDYQQENAGSPRVELPDQANADPTGDKIRGPGFVRLHEQSIRVVPKALGLPVDHSWAEIWNVTIANGDIIIGASPQGLYHDEFPFDLMEYGYGAHEFVKPGLIEVIQPIADTMSWLINSHFYNVRKALNDQKVVDPSRVIMKDLSSPIERGIIRLKPEAYGTDARMAVHQLTTPDMTQSHLRDIQVMMDIAQIVTGVVEDFMGQPGGGSRESATGVRTRTSSAGQRLRTNAEYNSALGFAPMMSKLISNTQQFMKTPQKFRIAGGDGLSNAQSFLDVNPELIAGHYDFVPVDGTLPIDRLAQANFWKELIMNVAQSPVLAPQWNLMEMIAYTMRMQGEKNVGRFRLDIQSPQSIFQQQQMGLLKPVGPGESNGPTAGPPAPAVDVPGGATGNTL